MSDPTAVFYCANHMGVPTSRACSACGRPFCESCLTEFGGAPLCGWCRDARLARMQPTRACDPATVVLWARIYNAVALVMGGAMTALYAVAFAFPFFTALGPGGSGSAPGVKEPTVQVTVAVAAGMMLLSALLYLPPAIGLGPRRGWLWTWQLVVLVLSVLGGCILFSSVGMLLLAPAVLLWIFWIKPEVRQYCEEG